MSTPPAMSMEERRLVSDQLDALDYTQVYRCPVTDWHGIPIALDSVDKVFRPNGRARIGLLGASMKDDQDTEIRFAYLDEVEMVGGTETGFVNRTQGGSNDG